MTKQAILEHLRHAKAHFAAEDVHILGLFGSYARNDATEESDIDILIETGERFLENHRGFHAFARLLEIKQQLEQELGRPVDLVDKKGLEQHRNDHILLKALYV